MRSRFTPYTPLPPKSRQKLSPKISAGFSVPGVNPREPSIMKLPSLLTSTVLALALSAGLSARAQSAHDKPAGHSADKKAPAASPADSEIIAKARATYPLKACLVSDEALGSMGEAVAHIHRVAGKPDRVIFVCCSGCIDDFKADPAKFLKKLDAAKKA